VGEITRQSNRVPILGWSVNETIVREIQQGGVQEAIDEHRTGHLVDLVIDRRRSLGDFNEHI